MDLTDFLLARIAEEDQSSVHYEHCAVHYWECDCSATEQLERHLEAQRRIVEEHPATDPFNHEGDRYCRRRLHHEDDTGYPDEWAQAFYPCPTLRHLATAYADHPDYREEWA